MGWQRRSAGRSLRNAQFLTRVPLRVKFISGSLGSDYAKPLLSQAWIATELRLWVLEPHCPWRNGRRKAVPAPEMYITRPRWLRD
jgi:hypothetical protein